MVGRTAPELYPSMGIQISGLLSGAAFDWKSVVDQLIAADSIPITTLQTEKATNTTQISALGEIKTSLQELQDSLQTIRSGDPFKARTVTSSDATSTWIATSSSGAKIGSYEIEVTQLATESHVDGTANIGSALTTSSDVSSLTLSSMRTATAVTTGSSTFTVNGGLVTIASTDSLQSVFDAISTATSGDVTASYDSGTDKVTLTSGSGKEIVLGANNDTSNFLSVMGLSNNGTSTVASSSNLGVVKTTATLSSAGLATTPTANTGGDGTFAINGVSVSYNLNTDTLSSIISKINASTAGVTASYDSTKDRVILTNDSTGDTGMSVKDTSGTLLTALGLTGVAVTRGDNAKFAVNGGDTIVSKTNTLSSAISGIAGMNITVNSKGTQTLSVHSDSTSMQTVVEDLITKFNAVQDLIEKDTAITTSGSTTTSSVLSSNHEVQEWARKLQQSVFQTLTSVTGSIQNIDDLGIDFDGTSGNLKIADTSKLSNALTNNPDDVQAFFSVGGNGMVPVLYEVLTNMISSDATQADRIVKKNSDIDDQITTLQARLATERETLTASFTRMLDAQSTAQTQQTTLTNAFLKSSSS